MRTRTAARTGRLPGRSLAARTSDALCFASVAIVGSLAMAGCGEKYDPKPPAPVSSAARAPRPQGATVGGAPQPVQGGAAPAGSSSATAPAAATVAGSTSSGGGAATAPASAPPAAASATPAPATANAPGAGAPAGSARPSWPVSTATDDAALARVGGLSFPKPAAWVWTQPSMQFRALQYAVPAPAGAGAGAAELVFSVFAAGDGGPIEPNVQRWIGQFRGEDGAAAPAQRSERTIAGMPVILLELAGAYQGMGAAAPRPGMKQLGAVIQAPDRTVYVRLVGPAATVDAAKDAFTAMMDGMRVDDVR